MTDTGWHRLSSGFIEFTSIPTHFLQAVPPVQDCLFHAYAPEHQTEQYAFFEIVPMPHISELSAVILFHLIVPLFYQVTTIPYHA